MFDWLKLLFQSLFGKPAGVHGEASTATFAERAKTPRTGARKPRGKAGPKRHAAPKRGASDDDGGAETGNPILRGPVSALGGLDSETQHEEGLHARQEAILDRISARIEKGNFELPHLPSTSMVVMDMASNPSIEVREIVDTMAKDPVLSSRLMETANSVLYAARAPVETLHEAVMRIGMRALRSLIFQLSMRQVLFRTQHLSGYAEEIWRQAYSMGTLCRAMAPMMAMDPEKAFLLGLLHDIGKISLLSMIQKEVRNKPGDATPALVGRIFMEYHERTGAAMAHKWKLSDEFVAVASCHHDYEANEEFPRSAAFVSMAHRLDLYLSMGNTQLYWADTEYPQMEFLGLNKDQQQQVLHLAHETFMANLESQAASAA